MKKFAQKQFEPVSITQIKEILKTAVADKFDKMIISDNLPIKRGNYVYVKLQYEKVERQVELIKFPLYGSIKDNFVEFEGGEAKFGNKSPINSESIFSLLMSNYQIKSKGFDKNQLSEPFNYPLDENNGEIAKQQRKYFFPNLTYQEICDECKGEKYVKCTSLECDGRHTWTCTNCHGDGKVTCDRCGGDGKVTCKTCKGAGFVKCGSLIGSNLVGSITGSSMAGCNGKGFVFVDGGKYASGQPKPKIQKQCSVCRGKGEVPCKECGSKGEIKCTTCSGRGEVQCSECFGKGEITCEICYGDKARYGKVDCPQCKTMGKLGQIVYVNSFVTENEIDKILIYGDNLNISDSNIQKHISKNAQNQLVYKKVNAKIETNYDEYSKEYAVLFENDLGLHKNSYPLITKENMYYQIVPCIELSYKHMLTNTVHQFAIINFWESPEIIFHSEPELLKQSAGNVSKSIGGLFGKLFKTKVFKTKEDKKNEITLLIYLAKVDGKIEEEEKVMLSEQIQHLEDFTNTEKQNLFDLMNSSTLPELTKNEIQFSSNERANDVLELLTKLAMADGELEGSEKDFIEKVKVLIG